ncbi:GIY-YIG nuclease family protein [Candidatus Saccharibacteria bacterium]|nr:GIY-YIG nuclease family protein [Candidatus Saccharibacteria bacterium]MCB9834531.1 GIY-YIG nuclease family protein [Candidatus Nomurabacteria bacterium]
MSNYEFLPVVYILASAPYSTLYIGVTTNLPKRIAEHRLKLIPGFTSKYNVTNLVYYQVFDTIDLAISTEKKVKKLSRLRKIAMIEEDNPGWIDLYSQIL